MHLSSTSNLVLIAVSVLIAIFASFTALNLSGRIASAEPAARRWWILAAALALGGGTWAMHFVGMLAMPMATTYDLYLTTFSLLLAIFVSGVGLNVVSRYGTGGAPLAWSGLLVGSGIVGMHYTGMAAMHMPGITVLYDWTLVGASVVIALVAATAALWLAFRTQGTAQRLAASAVMGLAISGMHYTAVAGVHLVHDNASPGLVYPTIQPAILALAVVGATSFLLLLGLITAFFDRKLATLTSREAVALTKSEERYRSLIESASDIIGILDCTGSFIYESSSAWHVLGYRSDEIVGRRLTDFVAASSVAEAQRFLGAVLELPAAPVSVELSMPHKDGAQREFEVVAKNLLHLSTVGGIVVNLRDITERTELVAQLEALSETDLLTEALNRRGFTRLGEQEFERARRTGRKTAVIMLDIDRFKQVNDYYGHAAGDLVIARVAAVCREHIRKGDLLGRMGGEEFAILLADGELSGAQLILGRLKAAIGASSISTIRGEVSVTASFGLAYVDPAVTELATALNCADEALYEAKSAGRNCIKVRA